MKQLVIVLVTFFMSIGLPIEILAGTKPSKIAKNIFFEGQNGKKKLEGIGTLSLHNPINRERFLEVTGNFSSDYISDCTIKWSDGRKLSSPQVKYHISKNGSYSAISLELTPNIHIDIPSEGIDGYLLDNIQIGFENYGKSNWKAPSGSSGYCKSRVKLTYNPLLDRYINNDKLMDELRKALKEEAENISEVYGNIALYASPTPSTDEIFAYGFILGDGYAILYKTSTYKKWSGSFYIYQHQNNNNVVFSCLFGPWSIKEISVKLSNGTHIDFDGGTDTPLIMTFSNGDEFRTYNNDKLEEALNCKKFIGACSDENDVKPYNGVLRHPGEYIDEVISNGERIKRIVKSNCTIIAKNNSYDVEFNDGSKYIGDGPKALYENFFAFGYSELTKDFLNNGKLIYPNGDWELYQNSEVVDGSEKRAQAKALKALKEARSKLRYHERGRVENCGVCLGTGMGWGSAAYCPFCGGKGWYIEHYW